MLRAVEESGSRIVLRANLRHVHYLVSTCLNTELSSEGRHRYSVVTKMQEFSRLENCSLRLQRQRATLGKWWQKASRARRGKRPRRSVCKIEALSITSWCRISKKFVSRSCLHAAPFRKLSDLNLGGRPKLSWYIELELTIRCSSKH